jgi:hypothetical protein
LIPRFPAFPLAHPPLSFFFFLPLTMVHSC